jgi:hypothetical protein
VGQAHGKRQPPPAQDVDDGYAVRRSVAARTLVAADARLALQEGLTKSLLDETMERVAVSGNESHQTARRARGHDQTPQEAAAQLLDRAAGVEIRGHVVQGAEARVLLRQRTGLLVHTRFQHPVRLLEALGHAVEALGKRPEFVVRFHGQPGFETSLRHPLQPVFEPTHRADDDEERQRDESNGTRDGERDQRDLDRTQQPRRLRAVLLDRLHESIDGGHERIDTAAFERERRPQGHATKRWLERPPLAVEQIEARGDRVGPRHEQRTRGIALPQRCRDPVERIDLARNGARQGARLRGRAFHFGRKEREPVGSHAQAPCVVDGGGIAFQPPRDEQRQADRGQRHGEEEHLHADQFRGELQSKRHNRPLFQRAGPVTRRRTRQAAAL